MITPPLATQSYYVALFEKPLAQIISGLLAPTFNKDIETVMVNSIDMDSDITATVEMQGAANAVIKLAGIEDVDQLIEFNPMYLPVSPDKMFDNVELDNDGDITSVSGFDNPYVSAKMTASSPEFPVFMDAKINYHQFALPEARELFSKTNGVLYS